MVRSRENCSNSGLVMSGLNTETGKALSSRTGATLEPATSLMDAALREMKVFVMFVASPSLILISLRSFSSMSIMILYPSELLLEPRMRV